LWGDAKFRTFEDEEPDEVNGPATAVESRGQAVQRGPRTLQTRFWREGASGSTRTSRCPRSTSRRCSRPRCRPRRA
jgi:hypothetical protein